MGKSTEPPKCKICGVAHRGPCFQRSAIGPKTVDAPKRKPKPPVTAFKDAMVETMAEPAADPRPVGSIASIQTEDERKAWKPKPGPDPLDMPAVDNGDGTLSTVTIAHHRVKDLSPEGLKAIAEAKAAQADHLVNPPKVGSAAPETRAAEQIAEGNRAAIKEAAGFDKTAYQREYMRKRRAAAKAKKESP